MRGMIRRQNDWQWCALVCDAFERLERWRAEGDGGVELFDECLRGLCYTLAGYDRAASDETYMEAGTVVVVKEGAGVWCFWC